VSVKTLNPRTWKKFECQSFEEAIALFKEHHPSWPAEFANRIGKIEATYSSLPEEARPRVRFILRVLLADLGYAWPLADERESRSERNEAENRKRVLEALAGDMLSLNAIRAIAHMSRPKVNEIVRALVSEGLVVSAAWLGGDHVYGLPGGRSLEETMLSRIAAVAEAIKRSPDYNPKSLRRELARRAYVPGKLLDQHKSLWADSQEAAA